VTNEVVATAVAPDMVNEGLGLENNTAAVDTAVTHEVGVDVEAAAEGVIARAAASKTKDWAATDNEGVVAMAATKVKVVVVVATAEAGAMSVVTGADGVGVRATRRR
jgi:hypothetical protein